MGDKKIVYYMGCFANYYDPKIGKAFIHVMEANGFEVLVAKQKCCGLPMLANANYKGAEKNVRYNVRSLMEAASPGYDIITTCSSCNLMLRWENLSFFDTEETRFVASHTYDASEYLLGLYRQGMLNTDLKGVALEVLYHSPCHLKVQNLVPETLALLGLIPGLSVKEVNTNCCGMGGSYGMKEAAYELSLKIAAKTWEVVKAANVDKVVTECGGCKLQIESGTGVEAVHPMALLSQSYGV